MAESKQSVPRMAALCGVVKQTELINLPSFRYHKLNKQILSSLNTGQPKMITSHGNRLFAAVAEEMAVLRHGREQQEGKSTEQKWVARKGLPSKVQREIDRRVNRERDPIVARRLDESLFVRAMGRVAIGAPGKVDANAVARSKATLEAELGVKGVDGFLNWLRRNARPRSGSYPPDKQVAAKPDSMKVESTFATWEGLGTEGEPSADQLFQQVVWSERRRLGTSKQIFRACVYTLEGTVQFLGRFEAKSGGEPAPFSRIRIRRISPGRVEFMQAIGAVPMDFETRFQDELGKLRELDFGPSVIVEDPTYWDTLPPIGGFAFGDAMIWSDIVVSDGRGRREWSRRMVPRGELFWSDQAHFFASRPPKGSSETRKYQFYRRLLHGMAGEKNGAARPTVPS